jgi:hypothetical protein
MCNTLISENKEMPKIIAYRCKFTGKLFDSREKYYTHLVKIRQKNHILYYMNRLDREAAAAFNKIRSTASTVSEIEEMIKDHWMLFVYQGFRRNASFMRKNAYLFFKNPPVLKSINFDLRYSENVSNSHSCPFDGITNWVREKGLPTGYPGWVGSLRYRIESDHDNQISGSDFFGGMTGINTGTGGGSYNEYRYEVRLYASDWPSFAVRHFLEKTT